MFTYIHSVMIDKSLCECQNISINFPCAILFYLCLSSGDLLFVSGNSFPFLLIFFALFVLRYFQEIMEIF